MTGPVARVRTGCGTGCGNVVVRAIAFAASACALGGFAAGCSTEEGVGRIARPLAALCEVDVTGSGTLDVEGDYLPHVIACESGYVSLEALRAQAVAARTFLYYKILVEGAGQLEDGQGDQVYTCANQPDDTHYQAVADTSGEILFHEGLVIASFFVAGAQQEGPSCQGGTGGTETYVTYNQGKTGDDVEPSSLGSASSPYNRGCMSQNGAACLAEVGWGYREILPFYYGADIVIEQADGTCITPLPDAGMTGPVDGGPTSGGGDDAGIGGGDPSLTGGCHTAPGAPSGRREVTSGLALLLLALAAVARRRATEVLGA